MFTFFRRRPTPTAKPTVRLGVETLEGRELMSWGATPPAVLNTSGADRFTINRLNRDGGYTQTDQISRGEADFYTFTAQRTGRHTFMANATTGSRIDTAIALYDSAGRRIAYDDDSGVGNNSKMTANLTAGRTYTFGVSKYNSSHNGSYNLNFKPPSLYGSADTDNLDAWENGSASLVGSTLRLELYGHTQRWGYYTDHYIEVTIMDRNGRPLHSGVFSLEFRTDVLPWGDPRDRSDSATFNLSDWDLSNASYLSVTVGH
jgi:hypothetical protein